MPTAYNFIMELTFNGIKKLDVVSVTDGKNFGRVCDVQFLWPENKIKGFVVTGCKGFKFTRQDTFIPVCNVVKIGEDVILIKTEEEKSSHRSEHGDCRPPKQGCPPHDNRRSFEEYE